LERLERRGRFRIRGQLIQADLEPNLLAVVVRLDIVDGNTDLLVLIQARVDEPVEPIAGKLERIPPHEVRAAPRDEAVAPWLTDDGKGPVLDRIRLVARADRDHVHERQVVGAVVDAPNLPIHTKSEDENLSAGAPALVRELRAPEGGG